MCNMININVLSVKYKVKYKLYAFLKCLSSLHVCKLDVVLYIAGASKCIMKHL